MSLHKFQYTLKFEKEGKGKQRVEKKEIYAETGVAALVELMNSFSYEFNTGRVVEIKQKVD